ncbi:hypothetical protein [Caldibacillus phage CBP1]|uniref:Uncharacterized protein n=1 Tax=Caldibacillus debilis GB1 TaxID=1339248 RepID=A0A420VIY4_9BACI|nr:hypothetical protein [Caldibacillus phage CBP1]RKO63547.1 hypothetical protein Cdeb_02810 [Caldibacillus debilis GB1]
MKDFASFCRSEYKVNLRRGGFIWEYLAQKEQNLQLMIT